MNIFMLIDPEVIARESLRERVQKGAAYLDEHYAGWVEKIVPETLDLSDGQLCICGQMFNDYVARPEDLQDGDAFGFTAPLFIEIFPNAENGGCCFDCGVGISAWSILDVLWLDEIYWRKGA